MTDTNTKTDKVTEILRMCDEMYYMKCKIRINAPVCQFHVILSTRALLVSLLYVKHGSGVHTYIIADSFLST